MRASRPRRPRTAALAVAMLAAATVVWVAGPAGTSARAATGHVGTDFNDDGLGDAAYGAWGDAAVYVHLGGTAVPYRIGAETLADTAYFGASLATCDVNGDGFTDLVVGDPMAKGSGGIFVFYGSVDALDDYDFVDQDTAGVPGAAERGDYLGASVACGLVDGDPYADIVAGAPLEDVGSTDAAGSAVLLFGSSAGVTGSGAAAITQSTTGVAGTAEEFDTMGSSVAIGDVTGDGYGEVIIGALGENNGVGLVHSIRGTASSWTATGSTSVYGGTLGLEGFGGSLAVGSFDGVGALDVAVGSRGASEGGAVSILKSSTANLGSSGARTLTQSTSGVPGTDESGDEFGASLAAGDLTGDGRDDLLVGVPGEDIGVILRAGGLVLLKGSSTGLTGGGAQSFSQDTAGVPGSAEAADDFGRTVAMVDLDGTAGLDGVIGAPSEDIGTVQDSGTLTRLPGTSSGLTSVGSRAWDADDLGGVISEYAFLGGSAAG